MGFSMLMWYARLRPLDVRFNHGFVLFGIFFFRCKFLFLVCFVSVAKSQLERHSIWDVLLSK